MNNRNKQRITALTLASILLMNGCVKNNNSRFELTENEDNELVAMDDSYIDNESVNDYYYVVEMYNKLTEENQIYIVRSTGRTFIYEFYDVFTNLKMWEIGSTNSIFKYIKSTKLKDYIVSFGLGQTKYSYDDMKNIYEVIKENYVFEDDNSLRRKLIRDNIM